jgi:transcriptional regulator with XRE-family HTH domain
MTPKELRSRRLELGWSVDEFAHRLTIDAETVSRWESGDKPVDNEWIETVDRILISAERAAHTFRVSH